MSIREETSLLLRPNGAIDYQVDRVMVSEQTGKEERRLKVSRRQAGAGDVFPLMQEGSVLPSGCRFVIPEREDKSYLVIEEPPQIRTIRWNYVLGDAWEDLCSRGCLRKYGLTTKDRDRPMFSLTFPYVIFVVILSGRGIGDVYGFYRTEPLRTLDDPLFTMGITNYRSSDGLVCMGNNAPRECRSWAQGVERVLAHFW